MERFCYWVKGGREKIPKIEEVLKMGNIYYIIHCCHWCWGVSGNGLENFCVLEGKEGEYAQ